MKNILSAFLLAFVLAFSANATTISITQSSVEVITSSAATRTFYDLDDCFLRYKGANVVLYDAAKSTILFDGDTSEVSVTSTTYWYQKSAKLALWYQYATTTTGFRFYYPKRGVNLLYKTSGSTVKLVKNDTKNLLFETHVDSITISGVSGASAKLTYFRGQYFLEGLRNSLALTNSTPTVAAGAAAGTSPTFAVTAAGANALKLVYTPGTSPASSGTVATITLPVTYPTGTILSVRNVDANAKADDAKILFAGNAGTIVLTAAVSAVTAGAVHTYEVSWTGY